MSSGSKTEAGSIDFVESNPEVAPSGVSRMFRRGGVMQVSIDGGNAVPMSIPTQRSTTLVAPATSITASGLVPATDGDYDIDAEFVIAQANTTIKFQVNGADTNLNSCSTNQFIGAVRNDTTWTIGENALPAKTFAAGTRVRVMGRLYAKVGHRRLIVINWYLYTGGATNVFGQMIGYMVDDTTAITTFGAVSAVASGYDVGTFLTLTAIPKAT